MKKVVFLLLAIGFAFCLSKADPAFAQSAVEFFGNVTDSVIAPDSPSLDIDGKTFTMEAWVFPTAPQAGDGIIINKENTYEMALRDGDKFMFAIQAGAWNWFGGGKPTMNEWHHVAVTYDGKRTESWVDGKNAGGTDQNSQNITPTDDPFQIGRRVCCGTTPIKGIIDEVRISDVVRYTTDFALPTTEFEPDKNTRLLWHLNEGSGTEVSDTSGNKNTGKFEGGPKWVKGAPITPSVAVQPNGKLATMWAILKSHR